MSKTLRRGLLAAVGAWMSIGCWSGLALAAPATTHPRLWVTQADLPRLRAWAVASNPVYQSGLRLAANQAKANADAAWNWNTGQPSAAWADSGSTGWERQTTEAYAQMFAFMALVDPLPANRDQWAMRARAMLMYLVNAALAGPVAANAPFRDPGFATKNRANYWGSAWGLTVDWIYPYLSAADKDAIRQVFLRWCSQLAVAATAGNEHPQPVGLLNDPKLLGIDPAQNAYNQRMEQLQLRWAANNYFIGHLRSMLLMSLAFDASDDPPLNAGQPLTQLGNSLASYRDDAIGAWLYQAYATFENAATVQNTLGLPAGNVSLGLASGGLPVEGSMYGESLAYLFQSLLALRTAGYTDSAAYGPQVDLINSGFWDQTVDGSLHTLAPAAQVPAAASGLSYLGPVYQLANYGDILRAWLTYERIDLMGPLAVYDYASGNAARLAKERWYASNALEGGAAALLHRASAVWGNSDASYPIFYFLMFDPAAAAAADPRPSLPTAFVAPTTARILARSDWTPNASWFTFRCGWESINHENGDCGQFELYRKGQWLAKEWSGYNNDGYLGTPIYHNSLAIQNDDTPLASMPAMWQAVLQTGGQWHNGGNAGDPSVTVGANDVWAYAQVDATNLYNHPDPWTPAHASTDVRHASRSTVWLNPDSVVVYDRATTGKANRFKRFNLTTIGQPQISGQSATAVVGGQQLNVQSLLPAGATLSAQHRWTTSPGTEFDAVAQYEPAAYRLVIEDSSRPNDVRFLTVLQGSDAGVAAAAATLVQSSSGTAFEGVALGTLSVMFPRVLHAPFVGTRYLVPASVSQFMITGLTPLASYTLAIAPDPAGQLVTVSSGPGIAADASGVLVLGFPTPAQATVGGVLGGAAYFNPAGAARTAPTITSAQPPDGATGSAYGFTLRAGGTAPVAYSDSGTLPPGLALDPVSGAITGTPTVAGRYGVLITASNGAWPNATQAFVMTVAGAAHSNQPPIARADSYTTPANQTLSVDAAHGVLVNDSDADGDRLTALLASAPAHAQSFALQADGSFSYTVAGGYTGSDNFSYYANDGQANSATPATVTLNIAPAPVTCSQGVTAAGPASACVSGGGPGCGFASSAFVMANGAPAGYGYPFGLFDFSLAGCTAGSTVTVTLSYPQTLPANTVYWKYGPQTRGGQNVWYPYAHAAINGNRIVLTLTDGALGDDDLSANGAIADAGGPGVPNPSGPSGVVAGIPTLRQEGLLLLSLLLGLTVAAQQRRRHQRSR